MKFIVDGVEYPSYDEALKACWEPVGEYYYWRAKSFLIVYD